MENLEVKNVPFCGSELFAVQEKDSGKIYVSINSILRELGFNEEQVRYRRDKWNADKVLSKGVQKFSHPSKDGGTQETYCMEIKRLPLALAKIDITPKSEKEIPKLSEKLEKYQDECADVLAEAFLPQTKPVRRKTKRIGKKITISLYSSEHSYILKVGDDFYDLEVDEFTELNSLIPELAFMEVSQIATVVKAYLSVHEKSSPKLECQWTMECDE